MYTNVYARAYYIPTVSGVGCRATEAAKYGDAKGATNNDDQWQVLEHGYANVVKQKGEISCDLPRRSTEMPKPQLYHGIQMNSNVNPG